MAPASSSTFLTYITAWLTTTAWQAMAASASYIIATLIQGIVVLADPSYTPLTWHTVLIIWSSMSVSVLLNCTTGSIIAKVESLILVLHVLGFLGILVPMVYFAPHNDPSTVFASFVNTGGWESQALSFFVGFPTIAASLLGADCAVHMSEEIRSAATVVPRALVYTIWLNGLLAFAMVIALMFCLGDLDAALEAATTMFYPFLEIFHSLVHSVTGACLMAGFILVMSLASTIGLYASASRMLWSFARDQGLPFSKHLVKVCPGLWHPQLEVKIC